MYTRRDDSDNVRSSQEHAGHPNIRQHLLKMTVKSEMKAPAQNMQVFPQTVEAKLVKRISLRAASN